MWAMAHYQQTFNTKQQMLDYYLHHKKNKQLSHHAQENKNYWTVILTKAMTYKTQTE